MAQAHIALSKMARDPRVAAFLARGEQDGGEPQLPVVPANPKSGSDGDAAALASVRKLIEEMVELCLLVLDEMDGDPDLEDGADAEPSVGGARRIAGVWYDDLEEDRSDFEPSLGGFNPMGEHCSSGVDMEDA